MTIEKIKEKVINEALEKLNDALDKLLYSPVDDQEFNKNMFIIRQLVNKARERLFIMSLRKRKEKNNENT